MDLSKKLILLLAVVFIVMSGFVVFSEKKENDLKEKKMYYYFKNKYGDDFEVVEYRGENNAIKDPENQNTLILETKEGSNVNVREEIGKKGLFSDNYIDVLASEKVNEKFDYSRINRLVEAKTFVHFEDKVAYHQELKSEGYQVPKEKVKFAATLIAISKMPDEKNLRELYKVYIQMESLGYEKFVFMVSFSGSERKSIEYISNYFMYENLKWEDFDERMKQKIEIYEREITYEEFKKKILFLKS